MNKDVSSVRVGDGEHVWAAPRDRLISLIQWAVIICVGLADVVLAHVTGVSISEPGNTAKLLMVIVAVWPLTAVFTRLTGFGAGGEVIAENVAKFSLFAFVAIVLSYYLAVNRAPLNDALMVKIDGLFGFSWPDFFSWVSLHKDVGALLDFVYPTLMVQALLVILAVGVFYPGRPARFISAYLVSTLITLFLFALLPVAGPFVYFRHTELPHASYAEHYLQLRSRTLAVIPIEELRGIVSFPSLHVSSAVIITFFFRGLSLVSVLAIVVNIIMSISALFTGGHYLTEVLAGLVVGLITIAIIRRLQGAESGRRITSPRRAPATKS